MELIIVILFFSISAAVCVQLFFNAHTTDLNTNELSHAEIAMQNVSECFLASEGNITELSKEYEYCAFEGDSECLIAFDSEWKPVDLDDADAAYTVSLSMESDSDDADSAGGVMKQATVTVTNNSTGAEIISQQLEKYIQYSR